MPGRRSLSSRRSSQSTRCASPLAQTTYALSVCAVTALPFLSGCGKKEEPVATAPTAPASVTVEDLGLMARAPAESFLLVSYDGESEGGKRSYAQSLAAVRGFIKSPKAPSAKPSSGQKSGASSAAPAVQGPRSIKAIQQDISDILESAGLLPSEPAPTPLYREAILFAAAGKADGIVSGGLCASGSDFSSKLESLISAARARNYAIIEHKFSSANGYALTADIIAESDSSENSLEESKGKTSSTKAKSTRITLYLGASAEGLIGVSSSADAVAQCLNPAASAVPPIVTGAAIRQLVARHPHVSDDFLNVYFDLDLFKKGLESKRDALEKMLGASPSAAATPCVGEESCKAPVNTASLDTASLNKGDDDIASRLPSLQETITEINNLPAHAVLTKGSLTSEGAVTFRVATVIDKESPRGAKWYRDLEESSMPRALASISDDAAVLLGVHAPIGKIAASIPLPLDGQYASVGSIGSVAISVLGLPTGALAPELAIVIESSAPSDLRKLVKSLLQPLAAQGGLPPSAWQVKEVAGSSTDYVLSPFGVGIFIAEVSDGVLVSSTESALTQLIKNHEGGSSEKTAQKLRLTAGTRAPFAARVDANRLAAMARSLQATLSMLSKDAAAVKTEQIDRFGELGTMYLTLEFNDGFVELVWRKIPAAKG
jgi:hypothetical protein